MSQDNMDKKPSKIEMDRRNTIIVTKEELEAIKNGAVADETTSPTQPHKVNIVEIPSTRYTDPDIEDLPPIEASENIDDFNSSVNTTVEESDEEVIAENIEDSADEAVDATVAAAAVKVADDDKFSEEVQGHRTARQKRRTQKKERKRKRFIWFKRIVLLLICLFLIAGLAACAFVYSVIKDTPPIDPHALYDNLAETTRIYDDQGVELDTIYFGANRTLTDVSKMPAHLTNAFIAIEDKSFRTHHGFNIIRIFGAIKNALFTGGQISGTSTITQQLARNVYLPDKQFDRDIKRKISEAYYALRLEKELSKDEIIQAYLNTIYFGYNCFGVETAAMAYFGKSVNELGLAESAALAALPQAPDAFQFIEFIEGGTSAAYPDTALYESSDGVYVVNDASRTRRELCLDLMLEQGFITQAEYDAAIAVPLKDMLHPDFESYNVNSMYFADYCIAEVIQDLMDEKGMDRDTAWSKVYQGGLKIYTTLDSQAQEVIRTEFDDSGNYPWVEPAYDEEGNIIDEDSGLVKLFSYDNFFDENGNYIIGAEDYQMLPDGSMQIFYDHYLNIYTTEVADGTDYSLEFKNMFYYDDDWTFYTLSGGYINIPRAYKSINADNDLIISADFFNDPDFKDYFVKNENGTMSITPKAYTLNPKTIQPQVAMTIVENGTGHIKAMVGGRNTSGRLIYNRATSTRQPGSSIKPLGVYSAALQQSAEEAKKGVTHEFVNYNIDKQGTALYGSYLTAGSIVIDEETTVEGRQWPDNFGNYFSGMQTMRTAMRESLNTCAVKLWYQIGAEYSLQNVKNFGITTLVEDGPYNDVNPAALALGGLTNGVTTLEMASAYTVFPNDGVRYDTTSYTKVLDNQGNILLEYKPEEHKHEVLDPGVAWIMADMLHDVVEEGTATNAYVPDTFVGGKTGTTTDEKDDWFDGFTTNYSASLWIGSDIALDLSDTSVIATILWGKIMRQIDGAYEGYRSEQPDNVIEYNGEYFIEGTEKGSISISSLNKSVTLCSSNDLLATPDCPDTYTKTYNTYTDSYRPPGYYCYIHNHDTDSYPVSEEGSAYIEEAKKKAEEEQRKKEEEARKKEEEERRKAEEEQQRREEQEEQERDRDEAEDQENGDSEEDFIPEDNIDDEGSDSENEEDLWNDDAA